MLRPGTFALTALLAALSAVGPLTTDMYLPSLPDIVHLLGATTADGQLTISAYLVGFALGQIIYGPLSDRHGRKPVLIGAIVLYCAASLLCTSSTSIEMLIGARALQALGGCGGIVLARAIVRDLYSGTRAGRELSLISAVMALAPVVAPIIGGMLQTAFGWRSVFATLAMVGVAGIAIIWLLLPETLARRASEPISLASMLKSYRIVARNGAYLAYLGLATTSYAGLFAWISGASFVLQNLYGLTPFVFGFAFAIGSVGYMTGTTVAARIVLRLGLDDNGRRLHRLDGRRARHGGGGRDWPRLGDHAGRADGGLSRWSRHGAAAVDRRRADAVPGTRGRGLRLARLHPTGRRRAERRRSRPIARTQRLAAGNRGGGDGLRQSRLVDRHAAVARPRHGQALKLSGGRTSC